MDYHLFQKDSQFVFSKKKSNQNQNKNQNSERGGVESDIDDYDHSVCKVLLYILQFVLFYEYNVDEYVVL